jgi:hypothetical protein
MKSECWFLPLALMGSAAVAQQALPLDDKSLHECISKYSPPNGTADARRDAARSDARFYMHAFNGVAPGWEVPGLPYGCSVIAWDSKVARELPYAGFSEGQPPQPPLFQECNAAANLYAYTYNAEMIRSNERLRALACQAKPKR